MESTVKVSFMEIYNENIKDLLTSDDKNLEIREDPNFGVVVNGATEILANSTVGVMQILRTGSRNRTTDTTAANEASSRSHAIFQINLTSAEKSQGIQ